MTHISQAVRDRVAALAGYRCEYCLTSQEVSGGQMQIEHIVPLSQGGSSEESNLCLAWAWCNSYKWANTQGRDPVSEQMVPLFSPRTQDWSEHFRWSEDNTLVVGQPPVGRATVATLRMNNEYIVPARRHWVEAGWHPPRD